MYNPYVRPKIQRMSPIMDYDRTTCYEPALSFFLFLFSLSKCLICFLLIFLGYILVNKTCSAHITPTNISISQCSWMKARITLFFLSIMLRPLQPAYLIWGHLRVKIWRWQTELAGVATFEPVNIFRRSVGAYLPTRHQMFVVSGVAFCRLVFGGTSWPTALCC